MLAYGPQPPRSNGGGWWGVFKSLLVVGFLSLLAVIGLRASGGGSHHAGKSHGSGSGVKDLGLEEVVVREGSGEDKIAVLDVSGVISSEPWDHRGKPLAESIEDQLSLAGEDASVKAVILKIDSPGGEVLPADDVSRLITRFQSQHSIPVIASMGSVAASGGYYIAAPCQWIVANELTITGSIGVIMHGYNYRALMDKVGVKPQVYKSGRFKDMMSSEKSEGEISAEETSMVQAMILETFEKFKKVVKEGREAADRANKGKGRGLADNWVSLADGRILTGRQAYESGFVDELGNFDTAIDRAKEIAGIEDPSLVSYQATYNFSSLLRLLGQRAGASPSVKVELGIEPPKIKVGRPYFIWVP